MDELTCRLLFQGRQPGKWWEVWRGAPSEGHAVFTAMKQLHRRPGFAWAAPASMELHGDPSGLHPVRTWRRGE